MTTTKKTTSKKAPARPRKTTVVAKKATPKKPAAKKAAPKKVVVKKTTPNKPAVKKSVATKGEKRELVTAVNNSCFWVVNGPVLANLYDLYDALRHSMLPEQYLYHAMGAQNDFAEWVEHTLGDVTCAKAIKKAEDQYEAATIVKRFLKFYE